MNGYLIHYHSPRGGICFDYQQARDGLGAIAGFIRSGKRKLGQIVLIRRLSNDFSPPAHL